jgi:predicted 2-oxoglutarate/Fe(II)-dependent dioxygenase YbiX
MRVNVLDHESHVVTVSELLSRAECDELVAVAEAVGFEGAPLTTGRGFVHSPEIRNNTRVMLDDPERAADLWERVREHVPEEREGMSAVGLNERFRFYRYEPGQYFRWHYDGAFVRSDEERSLLTVMVYLNGGVIGGATEFADFGRVFPETGKLLLFQHAVYHQGAPVERGRKYVLRTDVMYRRRP